MLLNEYNEEQKEELFKQIEKYWKLIPGISLIQISAKMGISESFIDELCFQRVKEYINEDKDAPLGKVSKYTRVPKNIIEEFIKQGRIELVNNNSNNRISDERRKQLLEGLRHEIKTDIAKSNENNIRSGGYYSAGRNSRDEFTR